MMDQPTPDETDTRASSTWIATTVILGMILASGYLLYSRANDPELLLPAAVDGLPGTEGLNRTPADLPAVTIDGKSLQLSAFRGKVVVLDFWATWCTYCRQEIPHLVRLTEKYRPRGLEIVGLTIEDPATDHEKVRRFMERFAINYTVGYATQEMFSTYIGPGQQPIPQTLIFDREGRLRAHFVSFDPKRDPPRMESLITHLL